MDDHQQVVENNYKVAVIGAGPSAILLVSEFIALEHYPILWVDPAFQCGEIHKYIHIHSNNQVIWERILIEGSSWLKKHKLTEQYLQDLAGLDPDQYTLLGSQYDTLQKLYFDMLNDSKQNVVQMVGKATELRQREDKSWHIVVNGTQSVSAATVFLCIGGYPKDVAQLYPQLFHPGISQIPNNDAILPDRVIHLQLANETVAIFGRSHSGILAMKELVELPPAQRPSKIYCFYKGQIVWYEVQPDGKYNYSFCGVRGEARRWYEANCVPNPPPILEILEFNEATVKPILQKCTKYVSAIGFKRNPMPAIYLVNGTHLNENEITHDSQDLYLYYGNRHRIEGMYGLGIAFPEKWIDPVGIIDDKVGIPAFLTTAQHVIKTQLKLSRHNPKL